MTHPLPTRLSRFSVDNTASALLIEARSSVGPIELATTALTGVANIAVDGRTLDLGDQPTAKLELPVDSLTSGNSLYDAEVHRRLDARRFPVIAATLVVAQPIDTDRWVLKGELTIHGTTRSLSGSVEVTVVDDDRIAILGEQSIDIRDFNIDLPTTLMLRIFPDVMVRFRIEITRGG